MFKTPKFERITKDRAAKFVDMLSAIGGTIGLLTGFSIISGIEIVYFATKIIISILKRFNRKQWTLSPKSCKMHEIHKCFNITINNKICVPSMFQSA